MKAKSFSLKRIKTKADRRAVKNGCWFDEDAAKRTVDFFQKYLRHSKGEWAGQPFKLEKWQRHIIESLFGWKRKDGSRRYREAYVSVPRKNGKSTMASGIAALLLFDNEPGAHVFAAAASKDQARIVFLETKSMFEMSPKINKFAEIYRNEIRIPRTNCFFKVISADARLQHGLNVHGAVIDELHAHKSRELYDVLKTSTGSRRQPLIFIITTSGYDQSSICYEVDTYARQILNHTIYNDSFFAYIKRADEEDDWTKVKTWKKANPNYNVSVKPTYLREEYEKAKTVVAYQNTFKQLLLNMWTQQSTRWIDLTLWDQNVAGEVNEADLIGKECYAGLDLASVSDMTAWAMLFPNGEKVDVLVRFWVPEARLFDSGNKYRDQYRAWAEQGYLQTTPGDATDYEFIREQILEDAQTFNIQSISADKYFQGGQFLQELSQEGLNVFEARMGFLTMGYLTKELEHRLLNKTFNHGKNPVLRFHADSVAVKKDPAGNLKPCKQSSQGKIDGIVACLLAMDRLVRKEPAQKSVYEERDMLFLEG